MNLENLKDFNCPKCERALVEGAENIWECACGFFCGIQMIRAQQRGGKNKPVMATKQENKDLRTIIQEQNK